MEPALLKQVKALIANNDLKEALDLLISNGYMEGQERHNTILLLRSRLTMLQEQELAGMLDFDEVAQQKAKIAHALLQICEEKPEVEVPAPPPVRERVIPKGDPPIPKPPASFRRYFLVGTIAILSVFVLVFLVRKLGKKADRPAQTEVQRLPDGSNDSKESGRTDPQILDFPRVNTQVNLGDMRYTIKGASVEKYSGGTGKLTFTLNFDYECRTNLGKCSREKIRILADGKEGVLVGTQNTPEYVASGRNGSDQLRFSVDAGAKLYSIKIKKDGTGPWRRNFYILK